LQNKPGARRSVGHRLEFKLGRQGVIHRGSEPVVRNPKHGISLDERVEKLV
jgi:hypothetical protein